MDTTALHNLGLSRSEIVTYTILIELGSATAGQIAKHAPIFRSGIYEALERLSRKGLVGFILKGKRKHFEVVHPEKLLDFVDVKRNELDEIKKQLEKLLPELLLKRSPNAKQQEAVVYTGIQGVRAFLELLIKDGKQGDTIYAFGIPKEMRTWYGGYFKEYHKKRLAKGIKTKLIFSYEAYTTSYEESRKLIQVRYFAKGKSFPAEVVILNEVVGVVVPAHNPIVFMMRNSEVAKSFLDYFELLWDQANPIKI